jgi:hypothetical protein
MPSFDLILALPSADAGDQEWINATVVSPLGSEPFTLAFTAERRNYLDLAYRKWRSNFTRHHDAAPDFVGPGNAKPAAAAVKILSLGLVAKLDTWLQEADWQPLRRHLEAEVLRGVPLRLRFAPADSSLAQLPWECSSLRGPFDGDHPRGRPIWRLPTSLTAPHGPVERPSRCPRLLVLLGQPDQQGPTSADLDLRGELNNLRRLNRRGGLEICELAAEPDAREALWQRFKEPLGWDALVFLGHSEKQTDGSGRLRLADGIWLSGRELAGGLRLCPEGGCPQVVLFNSCSGLALAEDCLAAGVDWVIAYREHVPDRAASLAFCTLLEHLCQDLDLATSLDAAREKLADSAPGCDLLLSTVCSDAAAALRLPLSRTAQLRSRLRRSTRAQAVAASLALLVGLGMDLEPTNPLSIWLLDGRLVVQRLWRKLIHNPGLRSKPLPLLLLNNSEVTTALGFKPIGNHVSRAALAEVLRSTPVSTVPVVALDVILDEPQPGTAELAQVIREQQRRKVFAGYPPSGSADRRAVNNPKPLPQLFGSGLQSYSLVVGTTSERRGELGLQIQPLQISQMAVGPDSFAAEVARALNQRLINPALPLHAVIDWSIDWAPLLSLQRVEQLQALRSPVLLVGADGSDINLRQDADLFWAPRAISWSFSDSKTSSPIRDILSNQKLPGVLLQAVEAQSMALGHWLTPWPTAPTTALAAGLGVLAAAAIPSRRQRVLAWLVVGGLALPLALQLAVSTKVLVPLVLPLLAGAATAFTGVGRGPRLRSLAAGAAGPWAAVAAAGRRR